MAAARKRSMAASVASGEPPLVSLDALEAQAHSALVQVQECIGNLDLNLDAVLAHVAQAALQASPADGVLLEMREGQQLVARAAAGQAVRPVGSPLPLAESFLWERLAQGQSVLCNDTHAQGWHQGTAYRRDTVHAVLAVPIQADGAVVGALKATATRPQVFVPRHQAHLQILAQSLGTMLRLRQVAEKLQESEQQYRQLFQLHPQAMWVYSQDSKLRILAVNQAMQLQLGYTEAQLLSMGLPDLWVPEDRAAWSAKVLALTQNQKTLHFDHRLVHRDGSVLDVEINGSSIVFNGLPARQVMAIDVTERLRAQREVERLARAQRLLSRCNEALVRASSEPGLLQSICRLVVNVGGYAMAWVGFAQQDAEKTIHIASSAGSQRQVLDRLNLSWDANHPQGQGPAGTTLRTGQITVVGDVRRSASGAAWAQSLLELELQGLVSLPLQTPGRTFGLLQLYASGVLALSSDERKLLQQLADDLAFGIQSLRARQEQQRLQESVLRMAAAVSATTGEAFFTQLAQNMCKAVGANVGCIGRFSTAADGQMPRSAQALAIVSTDQLLTKGVWYELQGTPSQELLHQRQFVVRSKLNALFPQAPIVQKMQAQGFVGQQLCNSAGEAIGVIFVLFRQALEPEQVQTITTLMEIFANRSAAELERQTAEQQLRHQASLLDKAQDAIIERDLQQRIIYWNQGAERLYGWTAAQALGQVADGLIYSDAPAFEHANTSVLSRGEWAGELSQKHQAGHHIEVQSRWTLVLDASGHPTSVLEINTDIRQRKAKDREIQRLAFYDTLTGLPNRMLLLDRAQHALAHAQRQKMGGALLYIDLDNFKTLNDTLGHDKGDLLLQEVARRLAHSMRETDTVARLGGDEFVVLIETLSSEPQLLAIEARNVAEKVLTDLAQPYTLGNYHYRSTPSIGVAPFLGADTTVMELLKQADLAMYQAKAAGRNTLRFFDPQMQAMVNERAALEADLRLALAREQFVLHFQPQVDCSGHFVGVEALVRWNHPTRGMVSPSIFIPAAEETGLILLLGRWVLHTACKLLASWRNHPALSHLTMAVNVSPKQFHHEDFLDEVARTLSVTNAAPDRLKLELTENLLVQDVDQTIAVMNALRSLGVQFSLDDFGTGYSSLNYLKRMPLDQIKIDQSFVRDLFSDQNDEAIIHTIIALGQSLGLEVIAEGVETADQHLLLTRAGCPVFQGYLFSKPVPQDVLERLLSLQG